MALVSLANHSTSGGTEESSENWASLSFRVACTANSPLPIPLRQPRSEIRSTSDNVFYQDLSILGRQRKGPMSFSPDSIEATDSAAQTCPSVFARKTVRGRSPSTSGMNSTPSKERARYHSRRTAKISSLAGIRRRGGPCMGRCESVGKIQARARGEMTRTPHSGR